MSLQGKIGFLGFGNMGSAILKGLIQTGTVAPENAAVYEICHASEALGQSAVFLQLGITGPQISVFRSCQRSVHGDYVRREELYLGYELLVSMEENRHCSLFSRP